MNRMTSPILMRDNGDYRSLSAAGIPIVGLQMELVTSPRGNYVLIRCDTPLRTLNSSPWGGGFGLHTALMNRQVDKLYNEADPLREMNDFIHLEGLAPSETAGMLTAAMVQDVGYREYNLDG